MTDTVRITDIVEIPPGFDAIATELEEVLGRIGIKDFDLTIVPPDVTPGSTVDVPESPEVEAFDLLEWYDGEDIVVPPAVVVPQNVVPAEPSPSTRLQVHFDVEVLSNVVVDLAGLDGVSLVINPGGFGVEFTADPHGFELHFTTDVGIRLAPNLLPPYRAVTQSDGKITFEPDDGREHTQINLAGLSVMIDHTGRIDLDAGNGIKLTDPVMIGETGVIIETADIELNLSGDGSRPAGTPLNWKGLMINNATLRIPSVFSGAIVATGFGIGSGGVSGTLDVTLALGYTNGNFSGDLVGEVFGMQGGLNEISLTLQQNIPAGGGIKAKLKLPFFDHTEEPLDLDIGFTVDGGFTVAVNRTNGLIILRKPDILSISVDSIGFEIDDGVFSFMISGKVTPEFGDLDWPSFDIKELSIDSDGNVHLDGGWLDLPNQYSLDLFGFRMEITKLGFGKTDDSGKWIGFSGGLKLVEGMSAGASVEGLRITWYEDEAGTIVDTKITLNGVSVEFEVPDVLRFKGAVSYRELPDNIHRFDGDIKLELTALDMTVDGQLVVGYDRDHDYNFFAIYLGVELPAGIPLWATGLALYGMDGLFALQMEPDKDETHQWYSVDGQNSWYHSGKPGVVDLDKWINKPGSLGLGAGITIGTVADNGFTFSGKMLLVIVFPGPILMIEGKADLLRERADRDEEALFRALAVLDGRAGTFTIGLDAQYKFGSGGELIDIRGGAEAFFSLSDASMWHLYIGEREPREKRIRARIIQLFEANAYFMLDAHRLAMGAWAGYAAGWEFGPLRVILEAWMEGNALVSWKPVHFHGDYWVHGKVQLSAFGVGLGLSIDVRLAADVFDPFHLLGEFSVGLYLPFPLPDIEATISLEWGPEPDPPPLPVPLKEIAIEHLKVTTSWPLPPGEGLLLPDYDRGGGFLVDPLPTSDEQAAPPENAPVVPLDSRPHITFGRAVHDDANVGTNPQPPDPAWERIGDPARNQGPAKVRYGLKGVALHKWNPSADTWIPVARKGVPGLGDDSAPVTRDLFGTWAPVPAAPDGGGEAVNQVKLWLWSKNPFDYTRHTGRAWDEWFTDRFADYPCVPVANDRVICCDFQSFDPAVTFQSPWQHAREPGFVLSWLSPARQSVTIRMQSVEGLTHALCFPSTVSHLTPDVVTPNSIAIDLPEPARVVRLLLTDQEGVEATGFNVNNQSYGPFRGGTPADPHLEVAGANLVRVVLRGSARTYLFKICAVIAANPAEVARREEMARHLQDEMARWSQVDTVLEPYHAYRLAVVTTVSAEGEGELQGYSEHLTLKSFACFRTEGPPGLTNLSIPIGRPNKETIARRNEDGTFITVDGNGAIGAIEEMADIAPNHRLLFESDLNGLSRYVRQTVQATVPAPGEKAPLPRPVYRAYDVGVEFNEEYVDLMYRLARRDLGLYLYDSNNRPVRDAQGRLIVLSNRWGETEQLILTESERHLITLIDDKGCVALDPTVIPHDRTLTSAFEGQVLDPDTLYESRLVPLLLHEVFSDADLPGWETVSGAEGENGGPSNWEARCHEKLAGGQATHRGGGVLNLDGSPDLSKLDPDFDVIILADDTAHPSQSYRIMSCDNAAKTVTVDGEPVLRGGSSGWEIPCLGAVVQTSDIWGGTLDGNDPVKPGTMLIKANNPNLSVNHPEQPVMWTDYRFSVFFRATIDDNAIGVVFRYSEPESYFRFSMDRRRRYRRLVSVIGGTHTILAEDDFMYRPDQEYLITVEVVGSSLRIYQNGTLVFDVTNDSLDRGSIGLYCWNQRGARFSEVRVDDFRAVAPVVYRFKFTTSHFSNFFHQMHSYQDETWSGEVTTAALSDADLSCLIATAVDPADVLSDDESRAYEALVAAVVQGSVHQNPLEVQVTNVQRTNETIAFLVQNPEPVDWKRIRMELRHTDRQASPPALPGITKITDVGFGTHQPNQESVTLLLREAADPTHQRIEYRRFPGGMAELPGDPLLWEETFTEREGGLLFREAFGPNALNRYTILDEGTNQGPSAWAVAGGHFEQTSECFGGSTYWSIPAKPGTLALTGVDSWDNVRIEAALRSTENAAIGLLFRYKDSDNYYRFSMHRYRQQHGRNISFQCSYRRLIKKVDGTVHVLWEDHVRYNLNQTYQTVVEAYDDQLLGYQDNVLLFSLRDRDLVAGKVGFYSWRNKGAHFEALSVASLDVPPVLWQPDFSDLSEVEVVDEAGVIDGPSQWSAARGVLRQSSNTHVIDSTYHRPGTYVLGGGIDWRDAEISVQLGSDGGGAIGAMFRYQDGDNYYRFSMDSQGSYRRLIKKVSGIVTLLWEDGVPFTIGRMYDLTLRIVGSRLMGYLDGVLLFARTDNDLNQGCIGLYCWRDSGVRFERMVVTDRTRKVGRWTIRDDTNTVAGPSVWRITGGALRQTSAIGGYTSPAHVPGIGDPLGTYAIAGDPTWSDYRLSVRMRSDDDYAIGVVFRYVDEDNFYRLSLDVNAPYRRLIKRENGVMTELWLDYGNSYTIGEPFTLTVDVIGSRILGYLGEAKILDEQDNAHPLGQIGLYCYANTGARFEKVEVRRLSVETHVLLRDLFPENDMSIWKVKDEGTRNGPSVWDIFEGALRQTSGIYSRTWNQLSYLGAQAVGGDPNWTDVVVSVRLRSMEKGAIGLLFRYADVDNYYRFSMDTRTNRYLLVKKVRGTFTLLGGNRMDAKLGKPYQLTVSVNGNRLHGYLDGVPIFAIEDSDLVAGRIGLYCSRNRNAQFSNVRVYPGRLAFGDRLLEDRFDAMISSRWTFVDEGDKEGPSTWKVSGGDMLQTSNIHGGGTDPAELDKPGTYALAGEPDWTDYRISVPLRSAGRGAIGVMFRYKDPNNYYRFYMNHRGNYLRLIKKIEGKVILLWERSARVSQKQIYMLVLDCAGDCLTGYLNGIRLFSVTDAEHNAGRIGLYCWMNTDAQFSEVRVAPPVWTPYYVFGQEERLPAGTRVRIFSGSRSDAPDEGEQGIIRRFMASHGEHGRIRLSEHGSELRLITGGGIVGHRRMFLSHGDYSDVGDARVLRKGDQTGFFIVRPPGFVFEPGLYRLKMTYSRNNQAADPESQVFSQAGNIADENVKIDIPSTTGGGHR